MALKADRRHVDSDISFFMSEVAERGGIVSISATSSSGAAMDQAEATVSYVANPSGIKPLGVLMDDMVNLDLTRQKLNPYKQEVQLGGKVSVWPKGVVVTDFVYPGHTPTPGQLAYVGHSGYIAASNVATDHTDTTGVRHLVGRWLSKKNEDGFAKVEINLP